MSAEPDVRVGTTVARPAYDVWLAVADPARVVRWSPEAYAAEVPSVGPLPVGARFGGSNRHGLFRWSTRCTVVESAPGEAFAFDVVYLGMAVSRWRYVVEALDDGTTRVEEQWWDHRGAAMAVIGLVGTGVRDRRTHNEQGMRATLAALKTDLEA